MAAGLRYIFLHLIQRHGGFIYRITWSMWRCEDIESAKLRASPISRESNLSAARVSSSGVSIIITHSNLSLNATCISEDLYSHFPCISLGYSMIIIIIIMTFYRQSPCTASFCIRRTSLLAQPLIGSALLFPVAMLVTWQVHWDILSRS